MARGVHRVAPTAECVQLPMADGGEGTCRTLVAALGGELHTAAVHDGLGRPIIAEFGLVPSDRMAIIEVAAACGLELLTPCERNPLLTTTRGVGELVRATLDAGARHLVIGLGGTATNDAGTGLLSALGCGFWIHLAQSYPQGSCSARSQRGPL